MKKLTDEQIQALSQLRPKVKLIQEEINTLYYQTLKEADISDNDFVFDFVFNCYGDLEDGYTKYVTDTLKNGY